MVFSSLIPPPPKGGVPELFKKRWEAAAIKRGHLAFNIKHLFASKRKKNPRE